MPPKIYKKRANKKKLRKPSKALVKTIQKVVSGDQEVKQSFHQQNILAFDGTPVTANDLLRIMPNITNGIQDNERIGAKIKAVSLKIKGHLIMKSIVGGNFSYCKIAVRLMCVAPRQCGSYTTLVGTTLGTAYATTLLQKGSGSSGYNGTISDLYADIDRDSSIVYYDKIHYLSLDQLTTAVGSQNVRQTVKFFTINVPIRNRVLQYNDTLDSVQPQNCCPVIMCGYTYLDGAAADAATNVSIAYDAMLDFTDS